jgi:hypothetical protein
MVSSGLANYYEVNNYYVIVKAGDLGSPHKLMLGGPGNTRRVRKLLAFLQIYGKGKQV